jgi:hypothetical protein
MNYRVPPYVHYRTVEEEVMLLDERTETYLSLNSTAAIVWTALVEGASLNAAAAALVAETTATRNVALADTRVLVDDLVGRGLLEPTEG